MNVVPVTLREANDFVIQFHRHNGRTARNGGKFAIGCEVEGELVGVAIVGNPISATFMDGFTLEVTRTCVRPDAPRNVNSFLYGACCRAAKALGYKRIVTYTLKAESGASLRGAGWSVAALTKDGHNDWAAKSKMDGLDRQWQPIYGQQKIRWEKAL